MTDNPSVAKIKKGTKKLKRYYKLLKIIKDMQGEEEIKLKLLEAVTKH